MGFLWFKSYGDLPRKIGDNWNMRSHDSQYIDEHVEVWDPTVDVRRFLVCRCFKSDKFPLCDQSHGALVMQGSKIGPCLLEVRKDKANLEKLWWQSTPGAFPSSYDKEANPIVKYDMKEDAVEYLSRVDVNLRNYHDYHHVIETFPEVGEKKVLICRCWQSKRFPICDYTHRQLYEAGDSVGPYIAVLRGNKQSKLQNVTALTTQKAFTAAKSAGSLALMLGVGALAAGVAISNLKPVVQRKTEEVATL